MPRITGVHLQSSVKAILELLQFLLGRLLRLQMTQYVREIEWTLLQFDISFYSVLVHFCDF